MLRYGFLKKEAIRLRSELLNAKPEETDAALRELESVEGEKCEIEKKLSLYGMRLRKLIQRSNEKPSGTSVEEFEEDARLFFDYLYDYYEWRKDNLKTMLETMRFFPTGRTPFVAMVRLFFLKRKIKKEIRNYTRRQRECRL